VLWVWLFAPVRNLFAYAFDGMPPDKINEVNRRGSPIFAVLLVLSSHGFNSA